MSVPKRFCFRGHDTEVLGRTKRRECRECNVLTKRERRARLSKNRNRMRVNRAVLPVDGFEDEYGPVPPRTPYHVHYDQIAVDRAVSGVRPVGRRLTLLEGREVARIKAEKDSLDKHLTWAAIKG